MTENKLREVKPGDRLLIHVEVVRHDPKGYGLDLSTIHPTEEYRMGTAFYAYKEAPAITAEACSEQEEPYGVCRYTGEHGTFWAVEDASCQRVAEFYEGRVPDAKKLAVGLRTKLNYLFNQTKEE